MTSVINSILSDILAIGLQLYLNRGNLTKFTMNAVDCFFSKHLYCSQTNTPILYVCSGGFVCMSCVRVCVCLCWAHSEKTAENVWEYAKYLAKITSIEHTAKIRLVDLCGMQQNDGRLWPSIDSWCSFVFETFTNFLGVSLFRHWFQCKTFSLFSLFSYVCMLHAAGYHRNAAYLIQLHRFKHILLMHLFERYAKCWLGS